MAWTMIPVVLVAVTTGYAPAAGGVNCDGDCSVTAYGYEPGPHIAACSSAWAPGDVLHVPGYGAVMCGDRFGADVRVNRLDLWFATEAEAMAWGVREVEVIWLGRLEVRH